MIPLPPQWIKINSGHLHSICYYNDKKELLIKFKNNSVYKYSKIEPEEYKKLTNAVSAGQFFAKHIKLKKPVKKVS